MQITDIHFSFTNNYLISKSLRIFCDEVVQAINPSLVLVTGDLTHAKFSDERMSQQFASEWKAYHRVIQECRLGKIPWLDIRGNHGSNSLRDRGGCFLWTSEFHLLWIL